MKATEIHVGQLYAVVTYGRPEISTRVWQVRVMQKLPTSGSKQTEFRVRRTGLLNRDWVVREDKEGLLRTLKSGKFLMHWKDFEREVQGRKSEAKRRQKEREKQAKEEERQKEERLALAVKLEEMTGVQIVDPERRSSSYYMAKLGHRSFDIEWVKIEALVRKIEEIAVANSQASDEAMDILGDVF